MNKFAISKRSKKTLVNQLNVDGSSDSRRLNTDILPVIAPLASSNNPSVPIASAISLGSTSNRWKTVHCDNLNTAFTRFAECTSVAGGTTINAQAPESNTQARHCYWIVEDTGVATTRKVHRWNGSAWQNWTSNLIPGQAFYAIPNAFREDRRLYVYSGSVGGLKKGSQFSTAFI
jgi:hypothetical protein